LKINTAGFLICQIEDSCLKIAGFSSGRSRRKFCCLLAEKLLPAGADDRELSRDIQSAINKFIPRAPERLIISLPRSRVTWKHLKVPSNSRREIEQASRLHAGRLMFLPEDEVVSAYEIITLDKKDGALVSLMATSRADIARYYRLFHFVHPDKISFFLSSQGIAGAFSRLCGKKAGSFLILASWQCSWEAALIKNGRLAYTRSFSVNRQGGHFGALSAETSAMLEYCSREIERGRIKDVYLLSPGAARGQRNTARELSRLTGLRVNLLPYAALFSGARDLTAGGSKHKKNISYAALIGLSLNDHCEAGDFSLPEVKISRSVHRLKQWITGFIVILTVFTAFFSGLYYFLMAVEAAQAREMSAGIKEMEKTALPLLGFNSRMLELRERGRKQEGSLSRGLSYISAAAAKNRIVLDKLIYERNRRLLLQGRESGLEALKEFIPAVADNQVFQSWKAGELIIKSGNNMAGNPGTGEIFFRAEWIKTLK